MACYIQQMVTAVLMLCEISLMDSVCRLNGSRYIFQTDGRCCFNAFEYKLDR